MPSTGAHASPYSTIKTTKFIIPNTNEAHCTLNHIPTLPVSSFVDSIYFRNISGLNECSLLLFFSFLLKYHTIFIPENHPDKKKIAVVRSKIAFSISCAFLFQIPLTLFATAYFFFMNNPSVADSKFTQRATT